jgi:hypothetical protein
MVYWIANSVGCLRRNLSNFFDSFFVIDGRKKPETNLTNLLQQSNTYWSPFRNRYRDRRPTLTMRSINEWHRKFRKIWFNKSLVSELVSFSFVCALDHGYVFDISYFFNGLVIFHKSTRLIHSLPFPNITLFLHKLERKYCISSLVIAKHVLDQNASSNLILGYIECISCSWLGFYRQQNRLLVINCDYVRKPGAWSTKPSSTPVSNIETLY